MNKFLLIIFAYIIIFLSGYVWAYELRITEVLVDGSDEFVEITNVGESNFSGTIVLSGVKSSPLIVSNISLASWSLLLLGDNISMLSSGNITPKRTSLWLSLGDTNSLAVQLLVDGLVVDEFLVSQSDVQSVDNTSTSFHKLRDGSGRSVFPTTSDYIRWTSIAANPWVVYHSDGTIFLPFDVDVVQPEETEEPAQCPVSPFVVDEIFNGEEYGHYIELLFAQDWQWWIVLSWNALTTVVDIPTQSRQKNMRYLIATSTSWLLHTDNIIINPDLTISTGQILISSADGQVLSSVYLMNKGSSWYEQGAMDCDIFMTIAWAPSPWFDDQFLPYMGVVSAPSWPYCPVNPHTPSWTGASWWTGENVWSWFFWSGIADLHLSLIDYDPPWSDTNTERIGLMLSGTESVSLSGWKIMYESKTYNFLSWTVFSWQEYIRIGNFQLVNSRPVCVNLYYLDTHVDVACYDPTLHSSPYLPLVVSESPLDYGNLQFDILSLVYDPPGSDTDAESITIRFGGWEDDILLDNLRLRIGTKTKRIYGTIHSGQTLTLVGNFQMPNTVPTCVALTYEDIIYDEYCYDSTFIQPPTTSTIDYSSYSIGIDSIVYDPPWSDTDNEIVVFSVPSSVNLDLSTLYLSFDNKKRYLEGTTYRWWIISVRGNYQFPNNKATCVELKQGETVFDTYCYDPEVDKQWSGQLFSGMTLSWIDITIDNMIYDPPWSDTNNEVVTLTVSAPITLQQALYLSFDNKKKKLSDTLSLSGSISFVWNYQLPNSKSICVQLLYGLQILDDYCYDPNNKDVTSSWQSDISFWSGLQIARVLPNPKWKDDAKVNELIALSWNGFNANEESGFNTNGESGQTWQLIDNNVKLKINTTNIPLSGLVLLSGETVFPAGKSLSNSPSCLYLYVYDKEVDRLCYPQAKDNTRYYHPRLWIWAQTIPDSLIDTLNFAGWNLSKLLLKKIDKKICLTYEGVQIRCINGWESATSKKNRALLTLNNSYIAQITDMYYNNTLHPTTLRHRLNSYTLLSKKIKNNELSEFDLYGATIKPTELDRYVELVYDQSPDEYLLDQFGRSLFWHDRMDEYYKKIYQ